MTARRRKVVWFLAVPLLVCASCGSDGGAQVSSESAGGGLRVMPVEESGTPGSPLGEACFGYFFDESDCEAIAASTQSIVDMPECSEDSADVIGRLLGETAGRVSRSRAVRGPGDVDAAVLRADGVDELRAQVQASRIESRRRLPTAASRNCRSQGLATPQKHQLEPRSLTGHARAWDESGIAADACRAIRHQSW